MVISSGRQHALAVALAQDGHYPLAEALGFLVVQIARQAEGVATEIDEILQRFGTLLGCADDGDSGAWPHLGDAGPQVLLDDLALCGELADAAVGLGGRKAFADEGLLRLAGVTHQLMRELPRLLLALSTDDLQAHAEADVVCTAMLGGHPADLGHVGADALVGIAPEQM